MINADDFTVKVHFIDLDSGYEEKFENAGFVSVVCIVPNVRKLFSDIWRICNIS
jgi:hypothetical protein